MPIVGSAIEILLLLMVGIMMLYATVQNQGIRRSVVSYSLPLQSQVESSTPHASKVISAEVMIAQFIALHNLPFQAADHLSDLVPCMFPDSKIAADFSSRHTKTKSIICDALDPHLKQPVIDTLKATPFNLMCDESNDK